MRVTNSKFDQNEKKRFFVEERKRGARQTEFDWLAKCQMKSHAPHAQNNKTQTQTREWMKRNKNQKTFVTDTGTHIENFRKTNFKLFFWERMSSDSLEEANEKSVCVRVARVFSFYSNGFDRVNDRIETRARGQNIVFEWTIVCTLTTRPIPILTSWSRPDWSDRIHRRLQNPYTLDDMRDDSIKCCLLKLSEWLHECPSACTYKCIHRVRDSSSVVRKFAMMMMMMINSITGRSVVRLNAWPLGCLLAQNKRKGKLCFMRLVCVCVHDSY